MGSIRERRGLLFIDFRYRGVRCREYTKLSDKPANRKRLQTVVERVEAEILLGTFDYAAYFPNSDRVAQFKDHDARKEQVQSDTPTFSDFSDLWFSENEIGWKYSYQITLRSSLDKHVLPAFGAQPVSHIARADILAFRAKLAKIPRKDGSTGLSPARINTILVPLRLILSEAADRFDFESPYKNIKMLKVPKTKVQPFTLDEVQTLLTHVREDFRSYFTVRFYTGMRTGEVHGLKWKYIDFDRREILVRESLVAGKMTDTKTDSSTRDIPMSQPVFDALKEQQKRTGDTEWVFCNGEKKNLQINNVSNRVWKPLLRLLDLPYRRLYQTRHTAATLWLAAGENVLWVSQMLGHADPHVTLQKYAKYAPDLTRRDGSAFEALLAQKMGNQGQNDQQGENS
ncbi:MAG: site-specific integrase [Gammaproteobacteria bacterium]|nr:MAG: site-specific integrase [Gammaproteobacteria bacterium]